MEKEKLSSLKETGWDTYSDVDMLADLLQVKKAVQVTPAKYSAKELEQWDNALKEMGSALVWLAEHKYSPYNFVEGKHQLRDPRTNYDEWNYINKDGEVFTHRQTIYRIPLLTILIMVSLNYLLASFSPVGNPTGGVNPYLVGTGLFYATWAVLVMTNFFNRFPAVKSGVEKIFPRWHKWKSVDAHSVLPNVVYTLECVEKAAGLDTRLSMLEGAKTDVQRNETFLLNIQNRISSLATRLKEPGVYDQS